MRKTTKAGLIALLTCGMPFVILPGVAVYPLTAMSALAAGCVFIGALNSEAV